MIQKSGNTEPRKSDVLQARSSGGLEPRRSGGLQSRSSGSLEPSPDSQNKWHYDGLSQLRQRWFGRRFCQDLPSGCRHVPSTNEIRGGQLSMVRKTNMYSWTVCNIGGKLRRRTMCSDDGSNVRWDTWLSWPLINNQHRVWKKGRVYFVSVTWVMTDGLFANDNAPKA